MNSMSICGATAAALPHVQGKYLFAFSSMSGLALIGGLAVHGHRQAWAALFCGQPFAFWRISIHAGGSCCRGLLVFGHGRSAVILVMGPKIFARVRLFPLRPVRYRTNSTLSSSKHANDHRGHRGLTASFPRGTMFLFARRYTALSVCIEVVLAILRCTGSQHFERVRR